MPKGRKSTVVDTNVLIVANRRSGESFTCAAECAQALRSIRDNGKLLLDNGGLILEEYRRYLNFRGQPGVGDRFLKWFIDNRGRRDLCQEVAISSIDHPWRVWEEFPDDEELARFDPSDQKFVAVARASGGACEILQSSDHKWLSWAPHLKRSGVHVTFLCRSDLEIVAASKERLLRT